MRGGAATLSSCGAGGCEKVKERVCTELLELAAPAASEEAVTREIAESMTAYLAVTGSLTSLHICMEGITGDCARQLAEVVLSKQTLESFCQIPLRELRADTVSTLELSNKGIS